MAGNAEDIVTTAAKVGASAGKIEPADPAAAAKAGAMAESRRAQVSGRRVLSEKNSAEAGKYEARMVERAKLESVG